MSNEYLMEKLNSLRNEMSHIWGGIFITGGGAITILITDLNFLRLFLAIVGLILAMLFINAYFIRKQELINILNQLKKEE